MGCCLLVPRRTRVQSKSSRAVDQKVRDTPTNQIFLIGLTQQLGDCMPGSAATSNHSSPKQKRCSNAHIQKPKGTKQTT